MQVISTLSSIGELYNNRPGRPRPRKILLCFYLEEQSQDQICRDLELTNIQFWLPESHAEARFGRFQRSWLTFAVVNRAATAFRMAASTLRTSQSYLYAKFRGLRSRLGLPKTMTAMARSLAILFYRMLKFGQDYLDRGTEFYEQRQRDQQLQYLQKKAAHLGFHVECSATVRRNLR